MKKAYILILGLVIYSCVTKKPVAIENIEKKEITGKWLVESITENNKTKLTLDSPLLNDVSFLCFDQSIWKFNPTNNYGEYSINDLYCKFGKRIFSYHTQATNDKNGYYTFSLKPKEKKGKKISSKTFEFKLLKISEMSMKWQHKTLINNEITTININFKKLDKTNITER